MTELEELASRDVVVKALVLVARLMTVLVVVLMTVLVKMMDVKVEAEVNKEEPGSVDGDDVGPFCELMDREGVEDGDDNGVEGEAIDVPAELDGTTPVEEGWSVVEVIGLVADASVLDELLDPVYPRLEYELLLSVVDADKLVLSGVVIRLTAKVEDAEADVEPCTTEVCASVLD